MPIASAEIFKAYDIRGIHGRDLDPAGAREIGRAFTRVIAQLVERPAGELRLGLGRDMRLTAPEMAAAYAEGMAAEGARVLDTGQVGTEMLYFLVGSRELDGGLMCTASHNPKAYTGAKMVRRGAIALSGDEGIGDVRDLVLNGMGDEPGGGSVEQVEIYDDFQRQVMGFIDPSAIRPLKVVVDGGNGMAGPMVGPLLEQLGLGARDGLLGYRTVTFPTTSPTRCSRRTVNSSWLRSSSAEQTSASPGTATPIAASSSTTQAASSTATS